MLTSKPLGQSVARGLYSVAIIAVDRPHAVVDALIGKFHGNGDGPRHAIAGVALVARCGPPTIVVDPTLFAHGCTSPPFRLAYWSWIKVLAVVCECGAVYSGRGVRKMKTCGRCGMVATFAVAIAIFPFFLRVEKNGWVWTPTMFIGSGCKVHLRGDELPAGRLIVSVSKHLVAVIDGVIHDTYDCSRNGTRCVYGYYRKAGAP